VKPLLTALLLAPLALLAAQDTPPVMRQDFGAEEITKLTPKGDVQRDAPGPRPPEFPDFELGNTAVKLGGNGARLVIHDTGADSGLDFTNGDTITLEGWVRLDEMKSGAALYVIGKGRTGAAGVAPDNQNWALRLRERAGLACVDFLFATMPPSGVKKSAAHWHRWTAESGFDPQSGWHHVAVSYRFGEPESLHAWLDGMPQKGSWDMGGATKEPPVVDDDAVWIGSSQGGLASASLRGSVDAVAVHRASLGDAVMKARFHRTGGPVVVKAAPEVMPEVGALPPGKVRVSFHEGMPAHDRWLREGEAWPAETMHREEESFLLPRLPVRYDAWGIRTGWKPPVLVRMAADVALPPGKHRLLLRARGLSRLWVNGTLIAKTQPHTGSPDGEEPMTPPAALPLPGLRRAEHRQQEVAGDVTLPVDGSCRVVLETLVGGKSLRPEPGELCLYVRTENGQSYVLLQPAHSSQSPLPLTDPVVEGALQRIETSLAKMDDQTRRMAAASQNTFWKKRHDAALAWAREHPAPAVPPGAAHPVDAFVARKIERALAASAQTPVAQARDFHDTVLPILRDECFRCHGEKAKGGLRLDSREAALKGGDSGEATIIPGNASASTLLTRLRSHDDEERMPPKGEGLKPAQIATLERWVQEGAVWPAPPLQPEEAAATAVVGDAAFLRRVFLDTVGTPPTEAEARAFLADSAPDKRRLIIERLLADERHADHWMSYWQDVLAENPTIVAKSLNTTGPFRWFLLDSLRDGKPIDRMVSELIQLRGAAMEGGSAGFGIAGDNDAPMAAKGHILGTAFLGLDLQCARCHDSPYHSTKQSDLYALAAMLERKPVIVPKSSRVPAAFFEKKGRESLIKVTLKPDERVKPTWPFGAATGSADGPEIDKLMQAPDDLRERLATLITAPQNERFAQVLANRVWRRLIGAGIVEPAHDWEGMTPSHPELLAWLAHELVTHGYDLRHLERLILTSQLYQREATGRNLTAAADTRYFSAPERRRLTAEQVVDSLYAVSGTPMNMEELTFNPDGRRAADQAISLGKPRRAWMLANLANERDRPSLSLPQAMAVTDVMQAFGWSGARQIPLTDRETSPNVLQPGVLANSTLTATMTRAAHGSSLADLAVNASSVEALVESVFLRVLGRPPTAAESAPSTTALGVGFAKRLLPADQVKAPTPLPPLPRVTWSNHLRPEANTIAQVQERRTRAGPPADARLRPEWRELFEDLVWSLVNTREFVWMP
jgi:mono/diheme cytochrome c family protein